MIPILLNKHYEQLSLFDPANLRREARRQRGLPEGNIPQICVLDPDGDLLRSLIDSDACVRNPY